MMPNVAGFMISNKKDSLVNNLTTIGFDVISVSIMRLIALLGS